MSLAYNIPHPQVSELLCHATDTAGLSDGLVQIRELGDFAIFYRAAGLLQ
ncbi:MAG: hypothetical protein ACJAUP_000270 [Cellvibrionaceae bacterium]